MKKLTIEKIHKLADEFLTWWGGGLLDGYWEDVILTMAKAKIKFIEWTPDEYDLAVAVFNNYAEAFFEDYDTYLDDIYIDYDAHFQLVNEWVWWYDLTPMEHMAAFGMFITLQHDFYKFFIEKHSEILYS